MDGSDQVSSHHATLGAWLRAARVSAGLTQRLVSDALGVSPTYVSKIEADAVTPAEALIRRMADRYGLDSDAVTRMTANAGIMARHTAERLADDANLLGVLGWLTRRPEDDPMPTPPTVSLVRDPETDATSVVVDDVEWFRVPAGGGRSHTEGDQ